MLEQASLSIWAEQSLIEGCTRLWFVLIVVHWRSLVHQFMPSMRKLALVAVPADADLYPIFAHLCLILSFVYFLSLNRRHKWLGIEVKLGIWWSTDRQLIRCDVGRSEIKGVPKLLLRGYLCSGINWGRIWDTAILSLIAALINVSISARLWWLLQRDANLIIWCLNLT